MKAESYNAQGRLLDDLGLGETHVTRLSVAFQPTRIPVVNADILVHNPSEAVEALRAALADIRAADGIELRVSVQAHCITPEQARSLAEELAADDIERDDAY